MCHLTKLRTHFFHPRFIPKWQLHPLHELYVCNDNNINNKNDDYDNTKNNTKNKNEDDDCNGNKVMMLMMVVMMIWVTCGYVTKLFFRWCMSVIFNYNLWGKPTNPLLQ